MTAQASQLTSETSVIPREGLPHRAIGESFGMLKGIRIVDLTTSVAGPYASMLLSDFGAEVIKIERPDGDDARKWGPPFLDGEALWFVAMNRNKKSVVLDLRNQNDKDKLYQLVGTADVFITNQPGDVQVKLGLDYDTIRQACSDVIFASITGFGLSGARAGLTSYDLIAEGYSGIMDITGAADSPPQKVGAPAADMLAGQDAAMAVMAGLFERQRTGVGAKIDISLAESMTRLLTCRISSYLGSGEVPRRSGATDSVIAIYQAFETADRPITLGLGSDPIWKRFWEILGTPEFAARPEFASNAARRERRTEIVARIQERLLDKTSAEWLKLFAEARVPAGPIYSVDELCADAEFQARGLFYTLECQDGRSVPQIGLGITINDARSFARSAPPKLGEHTEAILASLEPSS